MPGRPRTFDPCRSLGIRVLDRGKKERDAFYSGARWMRFRLVFLASHPICVKCMEKDILSPATIPHHVIPRLARPDLAFDPDNLMALCGSCHTLLHNAEKRKS